MKLQPTLPAMLLLLGSATGAAASHYFSSANAQPHFGAAPFAMGMYAHLSVVLGGVIEPCEPTWFAGL